MKDLTNVKLSDVVEKLSTVGLNEISKALMLDAQIMRTEGECGVIYYNGRFHAYDSLFELGNIPIRKEVFYDRAREILAQVASIEHGVSQIKHLEGLRNFENIVIDKMISCGGKYEPQSIFNGMYTFIPMQVIKSDGGREMKCANLPIDKEETLAQFVSKCIELFPAVFSYLYIGEKGNDEITIKHKDDITNIIVKIVKGKLRFKMQDADMRSQTEHSQGPLNKIVVEPAIIDDYKHRDTLIYIFINDLLKNDFNLKVSAFDPGAAAENLALYMFISHDSHFSEDTLQIPANGLSLLWDKVKHYVLITDGNDVSSSPDKKVEPIDETKGNVYRFVSVNHSDAIQKICKYIFDHCAVSSDDVPFETVVRTFTTSFSHIIGIRRNAKLWRNLDAVDKFIQFMNTRLGSCEFKIISHVCDADGMSHVTLDMFNIPAKLKFVMPETTASKKEGKKKNDRNK